MRRRRRSSTRRSPAAGVGRARNGAIALVAAALLANAALIVLLVGLALELALHVGPALAGLIVTAAVLGIAFLLVRYGAAKLGALGGRRRGEGRARRPGRGCHERRRAQARQAARRSAPAAASPRPPPSFRSG